LPNSVIESASTSDGGDVEAIRLTNLTTTANSSSSIMFNISTGDVDSAKISSTRIDGSNNDLRFSQRRGGALTEAMRIDSSGNVGIGTTSPNANLQIHDTNSAKLWITADGGNPTNAGSLRFAEIQTGGNYFEFLHNGSDNSLKLTSTGGDIVTFDRDTLNVGIGTTSPNNALTVVNSNSYQQLRLSSSDSDATTKFSGLSFDQYASAEEGYAGILGFADDDENRLAIGGSTGLLNAATSIQFFTAANNTTTTGTEAMRIDSSGHLIVPNGVTLGTAVGTYAAANTLDDYEEGTWTPVYEPQNGSFTTMTMSSAGVARYTKIGRTVILTANIKTDEVVVGTASGNLSITGLPFISDGRSAAAIPKGIRFAGEVPTGASLLDNNTKLGLIYRPDTTSDDANIEVADLTTGASSSRNQIDLLIVYRTD